MRDSTTSQPRPRTGTPSRGTFFLLVCALFFLGGTVAAQAQSFSTSLLKNLNLTSPTSLQFGPDGRLYVSQQDGKILAITVTKNGSDDYTASSVEVITAIQSIPNRNDDGSLAPSSWQGKRQVTGIYVAPNPSNASLPVLYVGSSDPRIGAGSNGADTNLDTNSGIITKLTTNGTSWTAVDLVRGLPRSEENHATNGLQIDPVTNTMYVAQGGHTNAGAPSNNFALTTEYALAAAVLSIDLNYIESLPTKFDSGGRAYKYLLPTLNDPTRADVISGTWSAVDTYDEARHENAFIAVNGKFYVLGGREKNTVRIYDPATSTWSTGATMPSTTGWPVNLHHFQAVEVNGLIYVVGALTGSYPNEPAATNVYIYDPVANAWAIGPEIPVSRRRGSNGAVVYNGKIYLVGGNANGHSGPGSVQFDEFDPATGTFTTLPNLPRARDHFFATVAGDQLYAIAGRESDLSDSNVFNQMVSEVDVYDFATQTWSTLASTSNIPTPRAAPATGLIGGEIVVAGGESGQSLAHTQTEALDVATGTWRTLDPMKTPRHATQGAMYGGKMYVVAGSPKKGAAGTAVLDLEVLDVSVVNGYSDPNDPFGGNDGLNQAKIDPTGPVQIYSPGWRNAYDLVLTQSGNMWVVDNGANPGWGGHPLGESDYPNGSDPDGSPAGVCTNNYDPNEPGSTSIGPGGDPQVNNVDGLHVVTQGYYAGHPTPVRGNLGAGLYLNGTWLQPGDPGMPSDWNELVPAANPVECDYRSPGATNGALATWFKKSVNGIVEYTTQSNLQGDLLLTDLTGGTIQRVEVNAAGTGVVGVSTFASGLSNPLDVTTTDESTAFPGVVWVAAYGGGGEIAVLEPDATIVCNGTYDNTIDEDGDGYTNADEMDNGANPCSAADVPANNDATAEQAEINANTRTFLLSDLNDPDDDNDTLSDLVDPFQTDVSNGTNESIPVFKDLFLGSIQQTLAGGVGFTGLMTDGASDYLTLFNRTNLLTGGATGQFSILAVGPGTAFGATNTQKNGFQFGIQPLQKPYYVEAQMVGPYFNGSPANGFAQGIYVGTGSQDDYASVSLSASADFGSLGADGGIEVVVESGGTPVRSLYPVNGLVGSSESLSLFVKVDPFAGTVQPAYQLGTGAVTDLGTPVALSGALLNAITGSYSTAAGPSGLAVGVLTTTGGASTTFQADYEFFRVAETPLTAAGTLAVTPNTTIDASSTASGAFTVANTSSGGERIQTVRLDLRTALLPDLVFDPAGTAGATDAVNLTVASGAAATGYTSHSFLAPTNGTNGDDGYGVLELTFTDFGPTETFSFSIDVDPNSIKGSAAPGPNGSANVSGLEMTGSTVDFTFESGVTQTSTLFRGQDATTQSGGFASAESSLPSAPTVSVANQSQLPATLTNPAQTVRVTGTPGQTVRLLHLEAGLFLPTAGGYQVAPYDANSAVQVQEHTAVLDANGIADVGVTLQKSVTEGGINVFNAVAIDADGRRSRASSGAVVEYSPLTLTAVHRLNAGGGAYTTTAGASFSADAYFTTGKTYSISDPIAGTDDDALYRSERWAGNLAYAIPVDPGTYTVRLHFAEIYHGREGRPANGGERVFDVSLEGTLMLDNFDIVREAGGALTAVVKELSNIDVQDGTLNLTFGKVTDNPKISAIEVLLQSGSTQETRYTLATAVSGTGTVTKSPDQADYATGSVVNLTATPGSNWDFVGWTGDVTGTQNPLSVTLNSNLSVTAVFQEVVTQYALNTSVSGSGVITKNPDQALYDQGTSVEVTAVPDAGWYFDGWSGEVTGTQNPITFTMTANYVLTAAFKQLPTSDAFLAEVKVSNATGKFIARTFGVSGTATAGFDAGQDVQAPPAPPAGAFDARFDGGMAGPLFTDVRAATSYPSTIIWSLQVQGNQAPIMLTWDPSLFPPGTMTMTSPAGGSVDMKTNGTFSLSAPPATLTITFTPYDPATLVSLSKTVSPGWDLWGLSVDVGAVPYTTLLPLAQDGSLLGYAGAYEPADRSHLGRGYWVNFTGSGTSTIDGYPVETVSLNLVPGWNLIAGPTCTADLPTSVTAAYKYENGSYVATTTTTPFEAVWANVSSPTTITLTCSSTTNSAELASAASGKGAKTGNGEKAGSSLTPRMSLHLTDANGASQVLHVTGSTTAAEALAAYLLPPRPPQSVFDARFITDSRVHTDRTGSIALQSSAYPITVRVTGPAAGGTAVETTSEGSGRSHELRDGASFSVDSPKVTALALNLPESVLKDLPKTFALKGNYPNPFRDQTRIVLDLPQEASVSVEVYNILGQRVLQIRDQRVGSGVAQTLPLQGRLASGVYLYRLSATMDGETVTKTGKMTVVR